MNFTTNVIVVTFISLLLPHLGSAEKFDQRQADAEEEVVVAPILSCWAQEFAIVLLLQRLQHLSQIPACTWLLQLQKAPAAPEGSTGVALTPVQENYLSHGETYVFVG